MTPKNKKLIKILSIILSIPLTIFLLGVLVFNIFTKAPARSSLRNSKRAFVIPWSNKGYIAQGIAYDKASDNFYLTGYMKDASASPILVVNKSSRKLVNAIRMAKPDGSPFTGHAGGLSVIDGKIYIAGSSDSCFYVFDKTTVDQAKRNSSVKYSSVLSLGDGQALLDGIKVAYSTVHRGILYAGEFHRDPNYILSDSHQVQTKDGIQYALAVGFSLEDEGQAKAIAAYSIPDLIQGMCFSDDAIYLTSSWALGKSIVYKYSLSSLQASGSKEVCGQTVPLYLLTLSNASASYILPPMAEEIEFVDGRFYINNEAASDKYVFGKFTGANWCRSYSFE